jgi:hypothetical protein
MYTPSLSTAIAMGAKFERLLLWSTLVVFPLQRIALYESFSLSPGHPQNSNAGHAHVAVLRPSVLPDGILLQPEAKGERAPAPPPHHGARCHASAAYMSLSSC